eukprot:jgi/Tetstr1/431982/TSEL_021459.t1
MATTAQDKAPALTDEELAAKLQSEEGFDALAVQAQRESDEEYARVMQQRLQEEVAQERVAERAQEEANVEAEWDMANARLEAELSAKVAARAQREEDFQSKQQTNK